MTFVARGISCAAIILVVLAGCALNSPSDVIQRSQQASIPRGSAPDVSQPDSSAQESNAGLGELERSIDECAGRQVNVPEEARRHFIRGAALAKLAKTHDEFRLAAAEYRDGLKIAPCVGNAYFNYAVVMELADEPKSAIESLTLYLRATPNAPDAENVRSKIYELQAAVEMQARRAPATVYIYRQWHFVGSANAFSINIQGRPVGLLANASYLVQKVPPGETTLVAVSTLALSGGLASSPQTVVVEAGKTYYLELQVGMLGVTFHAVEQEEGAEAIAGLAQR